MAKKSKKPSPKPAKKTPAKAAKPAPKPAAKPAAKPVAKPVKKVAKAQAKAARTPTKPPAKTAQKPARKPTGPKTKAPSPTTPTTPATAPTAAVAAQIPPTAAPVPDKAPRKSRKAPKPESARPAPKPHVHAAAEEGEPVRGRSRAAAPGPSYNGIGDEAVRRATGKGWDEWLTVLDAAGAAELEHKAIAVLLHDTHEVSDWWSQMITVGYEQARGRREKHETPAGFQASMSKTIGAPLARLYRAWAEEGEREKWLGEVPVEIRVANQDKNIRLTWLKEGPEQGTTVEVGFFAKDANRGMVQVQQNKLEDAAAVARVKAFWSVKFETLRSVLEK